MPWNFKHLKFVPLVILVLGSRSVRAADIEIVGNPDQQQKVRQSLAACPSLVVVLNQLAGRGVFSRIRVTTPEDVRRTGPFAAAVLGPEIIMTAQWLTAQSQPYFDVRTPNEILPDNLCFGLGHLADHLDHPMTLQPSATGFQAWMDAKLASESAAFLVGWRYVREAALAKNDGKPLTGAQVGQLMINMRYRFAFLKAMDKQANPHLRITADASIPPDDANIAAITQALKTSAIADLQ